MLAACRRDETNVRCQELSRHEHASTQAIEAGDDDPSMHPTGNGDRRAQHRSVANVIEAGRFNFLELCQKCTAHSLDVLPHGRALSVQTDP